MFSYPIKLGARCPVNKLAIGIGRYFARSLAQSGAVSLLLRSVDYIETFSSPYYIKRSLCCFLKRPKLRACVFRESGDCTPADY